MMKLSEYRIPKLILLACLTTAVILFSATSELAQTQLPARAGHLNDLAGVVDETSKRQLANLLENLQQKTGIDFAVLTVSSTNGRDLFAFSRQVALDWNVGSRTTPAKSLLLVLAVNEKDSLALFSKSVQSDLPEAVLGEMSQRMKSSIASGDFSAALNAGLHHFVSAMAQKLALNAADFETPVANAPNESAQTKPSDEPAPIMKAEDSSRAVRPRVAHTAPPENASSESATADSNASSAVEKPPVTVEASTVVKPSVSANDDTPTVEKKPETSTPKPRNTTGDSVSKNKRVNTPEDDADESEEVELTLTLPLEARIAKLKEFLQDNPDSKSKGRALELLISAYAGLGDQRLQKGDVAGGLDQFTLAINSAPADMSDKLFSGVIAQIPLNLYMRNEREAAARVAQSLEEKFGSDAKHLVALSGFYIGTEQAGEAVRIATQAVALAPNLAEAHQTLGLALHISLRLEEALAEYRRALELDPNSKAARRGLADLSRGLGKSEEALALYRQQLAVDPTDKSAKAGLVLSLFDLGRTDEAKSELDAALKADPKNLSLLAGAAYWFAAHNDTAQANDFGRKALELEPRYTWSHVAMARTFVAEKRPLNAERALRFARQYGRFPTLDYELASTLAATGLYGEAAEVLTESFDWKDGQIETRLAGRTATRASGFLELLAPERRGSIFQSTPADTESNAKLLKDLLVFTTFSNQDQKGGTLDEASLVAAAKEFASGRDPSQVHRQLYAASRLLQKGMGYSTAHELAEAARSTADAGLTVPEVTLAVQADEYREIRARAIAAGGTPNIVEAPRNVLSNLLRGRIEDISGWALYNQDQAAAAVDHLQRAANILPARTPVWRAALWHLGIALEGVDKKEEALTNYIRAYNVGERDPARRIVIERLYRKMHDGSLTGLEELINGTPTTGDSVPAGTTTEPTANPDSTPASAAPAVDTSSTPEKQPAAEVAKPASVSSDVDTPKPSSPESAIVERLNKPRPTVVTITGRVVDAASNPIANAVVILIGPQGTVLAATTDAQGNYSFTAAPSTQNYRVIPSKDGFKFEPADRLIAEVSQDQKGLNFVGSPKVSP